MNRSTALTLAAAAVLAALPLSAVGVNAGTLPGATQMGPGATSSSRDDVTTLRFRAPAFSQVRVPAPSDPSAPFAAGDRLFWVVELYQGDKHVASAPHTCLSDGTRYLLCDASAQLPDGEVVFQTALDLESTTAAPVPVIGGSGCYRDATGQLTATFNDDGSSRWVLTLHGACG